MNDSGKDRDLIGALRRGLFILRAFEDSAASLSNQDLTAFTGLPKSTVSRLTRTLTAEGFLTQLPSTGRYQLTPAVLGLARAYQDCTGLAGIARPHLQELADTVRATAAIGAPNHLDIIYLQICRAVTKVHVPQEPGARMPIGSSAIGMAYLHKLPAAGRQAVLQMIKAQNPRNWPVVEQEAARTGEEIARLGFCVGVGIWRRDVNGAAVALDLPQQGVVAINVGGPAFWLKESRLYEEIGPRLQITAEAIRSDFLRRGGAR